MGVDKSYAEILWKEIEHGQAFVAFDGLDEVDPSQRVRMIEFVNSRAFEPGNSWLVGSRFTEYKGGQFKHGQFAEWELLPMSSQLRQELAAKLFPESRMFLSSSLSNSFSPSSRFVRLLENHSQAAAWGENPLLFSLAAVVFVNTGGLPPSRATLYREVIEAVLTMREQDTLRRNHLLRALTGFALWLHETKGPTFTSEDLLTFLEDIQRRSWDEAETISKRITASGILEVVAKDTYGFRHQTFREYLAGLELAKLLTSQDPVIREEAWRFSWSKRTYSRWTEVLRLMVGALAQISGKKGRSEAMRWLLQLFGQGFTEEGDPGDLVLALTLKSMAEVAEISEWDTAMTTQLEKQIVSLWVSELLDAVRSQRVTRVERFRSLAEDVAHLKGNGIESILGRLVKALRDPDHNVQKTAKETLKTLRFKLPIEMLLKMLQEPDADVRSAAVDILKEQGERVPIEALILLLYNKEEYIRQVALEVLRTQNKDRVPLKPIVELLGDEDSRVRDTTIQVLRKFAPEILTECATQAIAVFQGEIGDRVFNSLFQIFIAETIGDLGITSKELLEKLTELLDWPYWQVRVRAIQALGKLRRNILDTTIQRLLQLRLDPDPKMCSVREAADDALVEILSLETGIEDE